MTLTFDIEIDGKAYAVDVSGLTISDLRSNVLVFGVIRRVKRPKICTIC